MLFNSLHFALFFPVVALLYFLLPFRARWAFLLAASCYFYMAFVPYYVFILLFTILVDYFAALLIDRNEGPRRKWLLVLSIVANCSVLALFKYFNFFNDNVAGLARLIHWNYTPFALSLILPIGLSFHTFQSMSYTIEVYRRVQAPERNLGIFALYVLFYPQLVAGPIERPQNLLHQFHEEHIFDYGRIVEGLQLMAWGFFKKIVVADRLAAFVNTVYDAPTHFEGLALVLATWAFAFQIFCDFSCYSDIAIGAAQVMGFKLMTNFRQPYLAQSIAEFWKRWHISLSTWFRDYLYIPLGGNRTGRYRHFFNIMVVFLVSGLWHGANWTFVIWGGLNGMYIVLSQMSQSCRDRLAAAFGLDRLPVLHRFLRVLVTFNLVSFAWIFFRARSLSDAAYIVRHVLPGSLGAEFHSVLAAVGGLNVANLGCLVLLMWFMQICQERYRIRQYLNAQPAALRWAAYCIGVISLVLGSAFGSGQQFIYFQF